MEFSRCRFVLVTDFDALVTRSAILKKVKKKRKKKRGKKSLPVSMQTPDAVEDLSVNTIHKERTWRWERWVEDGGGGVGLL